MRTRLYIADAGTMSSGFAATRQTLDEQNTADNCREVDVWDKTTRSVVEQTGYMSTITYICQRTALRKISFT